jgi:hypothetical protein
MWKEHLKINNTETEFHGTTSQIHFFPKNAYTNVFKQVIWVEDQLIGPH